MLIRLATINDVPAILQLINEIVPVMNAAGNFQWDATYPNTKVFENDIALKQLWVADEDGAIAGVIAITTDNEPEYADIWNLEEKAIVIHRLAVSTRYRGKGIAAKLMLQAEEVANNRGIKIIHVDTNSANEATQKLFPKLGYGYAGEIKLGFNTDLRFYCYEKRLA
ncbi:MAG: putative acetyltransferase [Mucilaginibacter sp.]|nr:putative acetyltransferase [Mucilaginibacter sp.]